MALLEPLETNEKNLIKLDAVFRALKIENEDDIKIMAQFFLEHKEKNEPVYVSSGVGPDENDETTDRVELVHPNHVLKALKIFLEHYRGHQK